MSWIVFAFLAAFFLGSNIVVRKKALLKEEVIEFFSASAVVALFFMIPVAFFVKLLPPNELFLILLKSVFALGFFYLSDKALKRMDVSSFAPLMNLSPVIMVFVGYAFLNERITPGQLSGVLLIVVGAYLLELSGGFKKLKEPFVEIKKNKNLHLVFWALLFSAAAITFDRIALKSIDLVNFYFYQRIFIDVLILSSLFIFFNGKERLKKGFSLGWKWILLGTVLFLVGDFFYFKAIAFPTAFVALVIAVKRLSTLFATFFGGEVFHEKDLLRKSIACGIMVAGVFLIVI